VPIVLKYGNPKLLEPSGPVQVCNGIALPFTADSKSAHLGFEPLSGLILGISLAVLVNVTVLVCWGAFCVARVCLFCFSGHSTAAVRKYIQGLCMYNYTVIHSLVNK